MVAASAGLVIPIPDYAELQEKVGNVESLVTPQGAAGAPGLPPDASPGSEHRHAWYHDVENAVLDLSSTFPEGVDDYDVRKLLEFTVELGRLVDADAEAGDPSGDVEIAVMRAADVVRRIQRRLLHQHLDDSKAALEFIFGVFTNVSISEIARVLGTSTKTAGGWKRGGAIRQTSKQRRVKLVAQLLSYLQDSMTPLGLLMWFDAGRDQLDGRSPLEVLSQDPGAYEQLVALARGSRGQLAS